MVLSGCSYTEAHPGEILEIEPKKQPLGGSPSNDGWFPIHVEIYSVKL